MNAWSPLRSTGRRTLELERCRQANGVSSVPTARITARSRGVLRVSRLKRRCPPVSRPSPSERPISQSLARSPRGRPSPSSVLARRQGLGAHPTACQPAPVPASARRARHGTPARRGRRVQAHVGWPLHGARPGPRSQRADGPDLESPCIARALVRPEAVGARRPRAGPSSAHRRRAAVPRSLRPSRPADGSGSGEAERRQTHLAHSPRIQRLARTAGDYPGGRARLVGRARAVGGGATGRSRFLRVTGHGAHRRGRTDVSGARGRCCPEPPLRPPTAGPRPCPSISRAIPGIAASSGRSAPSSGRSRFPSSRSERTSRSGSWARRT